MILFFLLLYSIDDISSLWDKGGFSPINRGRVCYFSPARVRIFVVYPRTCVMRVH